MVCSTDDTQPWKTAKNDNGNFREAFIIITKLFWIITAVGARIRVYRSSIVSTRHHVHLDKVLEWWCDQQRVYCRVAPSYERSHSHTCASCEWQLNRNEALSCPWSTLFIRPIEDPQPESLSYVWDQQSQSYTYIYLSSISFFIFPSLKFMNTQKRLLILSKHQDYYTEVVQH